MKDTRKIDAAIALIGLGKVFPHEGSDGVCRECGHDMHKDKVCYTKVPNYGTDIKDASDLLSIVMNEAFYGIETTFNRETHRYAFVYKGKEFKEDKVFRSATPEEGIKQLALYHYNININEVTDKIGK